MSKRSKKRGKRDRRTRFVPVVVGIDVGLPTEAEMLFDALFATYLAGDYDAFGRALAGMADEATADVRDGHPDTEAATNMVAIGRRLAHSDGPIDDEPARLALGAAIDRLEAALRERGVAVPA